MATARASEIVQVVDLVPGDVRPIPSVDAAALDGETFWRERVERSLPLLVKGAARAWPAITRWTDAGYLIERAGDATVTVARTFNTLPVGPFYARTTEEKLVDVLRAMQDAPDTSVYSVPSIDVPRALAGDLQEFPFLTAAHERKPRGYPRRRIFVYRNAGTEWHFHPFDETLTTQLRGRKRVSLFRLEADTFGAYNEVLAANLHHTASGPALFPPRDLVKYETILEPGDTVYIPPFWWHGIDPADRDVGVTMAHCFRTPLRRVGSFREPISRWTVKEFFASGRMTLFTPVVLALIAASGVARMVRGEPWRYALDG